MVEFIKEEYIFDSLENSDIKIVYPQIEGLDSDYTDINEMIKSTAIETINRYYGDQSDQLACSITYKISFQEENIVSIIFEGFGSIKTAAHPNHIYYTLNIDLSQSKKIMARDFYSFDDEFVIIFLDNAKKQLPEDIFTYVENNKDMLYEYFQDIDGDTSITYSCFTPDGLCISIPTIYVIGDHAEVLVPYSELVKQEAEIE
jgi:hypothetical protein